MNSIIENERLFHNQRFAGDDQARAQLSKYYSINTFLHEYYRSEILNACKGAELLEYGCGTGETAFQWARYGAKVTGIDISDEGIRKAKETAKNQQINAAFHQMDAQNMHQFAADSFDIVTGSGILHHLNLDKAYDELARVLRRNGRAIFIEPLGQNMFINLYRKLTPSLRTEDEHPLTMKDIEAARKYFGEIRIQYFHIFTLLAVPFRRRSFFNSLLKVLDLIDRSMMNVFPFVRRYSWIVVIEFYDRVRRA